MPSLSNTCSGHGTGEAVATTAAEEDDENACARAEPCTTSLSTICCWGGLLTQIDERASLQRAPCAPGFKASSKHLKDKFCATCRRGFYVPLSHVRAIQPDKAALVRSLTCLPPSLAVRDGITRLPLTFSLHACLLANAVSQLSGGWRLGKHSYRRDGGVLLPGAQPDRETLPWPTAPPLREAARARAWRLHTASDRLDFGSQGPPPRACARHAGPVVFCSRPHVPRPS